MGTETVPPALFQSEMPDPITSDSATTPPDTPTDISVTGDQSPATPVTGETSTENTEEDTPELVKMPDGRELTAAEAVREMKEHFLPEYTRATQELAKLKSTLSTPAVTESESVKHPWDDPDWVPSTTKELLDAAVARVEEQQQAKAAQEAAALANLRAEIEAQLAEIKSKDPNLNEDDLFAHANRFKFTDLRLAYDNMVEIRNQRKLAAEEAVKNRLERAQEPISGTPGAPGATPGGVDWNKISSAGSTLDLVQEMLQRGK
jgi:hypothetical protein